MKNFSFMQILTHLFSGVYVKITKEKRETFPDFQNGPFDPLKRALSCPETNPLRAWNESFNGTERAFRQYRKATFRYKISHFAAHLPPNKAIILNFHNADVCAKYREKHRNEGFVHVFWYLREQDLDTFCPFSKVWHLRGRGFWNIVSHWYSAF